MNKWDYQREIKKIAEVAKAEKATDTEQYKMIARRLYPHYDPMVVISIAREAFFYRL